MIDQTPIRTIKLYGKLRKFGKEFKLAVKSPAEAIKALCVQVPGFEKFLADSKKNNLEYAVFNGKNNICQDELGFSGSDEIRIAPVISGSKRNGLFQTILGVVLIAVAWWNPFGWTAGGALISGTMAAGIGLAAGGIVQMLSPQPRGIDAREPTENTPSKSFGGAVNTTALGQPIPILAGRRVCGGALISAGIFAQDAV